MTLLKLAMDGKILEHCCIGPQMYRLLVHCPAIARQSRPGQFVQVRVERGQLLLRRPISLADADAAAGTLTLIYRVVGKGTAAMAGLQPGDTINCLGPLGHGFSCTAEKPLLVGGGMGIAPLLFLAKAFAGRASILMGGRSAEEMFWPGLYDKLVQDIFITTDDGSMGTKGFTVTLLPQLLQKGTFDQVFVCGPEIMMRCAARIASEAGIACEVSLEKRMACGLGACLSCSIDTTDGQRKKVCKDGPVFPAQEVF